MMSKSLPQYNSNFKTNFKTNFKEIEWSPQNFNSFRAVRKSLENRRNAKIYLSRESWKNDLPLLCSKLGLKYQASAMDVRLALESSSAFSAKAIEAANFSPSCSKESTEVISWVKEGIEDQIKSVRMKIRIPMKYEQELASGKSASGSNRRGEFELFVKRALSDAFRVPKLLLDPEIHIAEIQDGSVSVIVILSAAALILIYVGRELPQTVTWQEKKFEILMGMGGAAVGSIVGVAAGGSVEAAMGSLIGLCTGLTTSWFVNRDVQDAEARAIAYLTFIGSAIVIIIRHFHQDQVIEQ